MKKLLAVVICICLLGSIATAENATAKLQELYSSAELLMATGNYSEAADIFDSLGAFSDSSQMAMYCKAVSAAEDLGFYDIAVSTFTLLDDFRDSKQMALYYTGRELQAAGDKCNTETATDQELENASNNYKEAIKVFGDLALFKDSLTRYKSCEQKLQEIETVQQDRRNQELEAAYQAALSLETDGKYTEALTAFKKIITYKDSKEHIETCGNALLEEQYQNALELEAIEQYTEAIAVFESIKSYKDSEEHIETCINALLEEQYQNALGLETAEQYMEAISVFTNIKSYKDSEEHISSCCQQLLIKEFPVYTSKTSIDVNNFCLHGIIVFGMSPSEVEQAEKNLGNKLQYWDGIKNKAHYYVDVKDYVEGIGDIVGVNYYFDDNDLLNCVDYRISFKLAEKESESKYKETGSALRQTYGEPTYMDNPDAFILPQNLHKNGIGIPEDMSAYGISDQYEQWIIVLADGSIISIVNELELNNNYSAVNITLSYFRKEEVEPVLQAILNDRLNEVGK